MLYRFSAVVELRKLVCISMSSAALYSPSCTGMGRLVEHVSSMLRHYHVGLMLIISTIARCHLMRFLVELRMS